MIEEALAEDKPESLFERENLEEFPEFWRGPLGEEIDALFVPPPQEFPEALKFDWEYISSRDPRQARLYILAEDEKLGKELEKYLNKAGLARGSSLNLVIIGALSLTLYLIKVGFTWNVFLFGAISTVTLAVLAYNTWRQSALVYYFTLWDLLKLTQQRRIRAYYENRRK